MSDVPDLVALRRELHAHPELSLVEHGTADRIDGWLRSLGLKPRRVATTGVTAMVRGKKRGKRTILARADMDALPVHEATDLAFRSTNDGVMHACGHDCHIASLVDVSRRLAADPPERGNVKLLFQPGEEGANGMGLCIDAGILERPTVDAAVGIHVWANEKAGRIGLVRGPCMAAIDDFVVRIVGRGGHGAYPHDSVDPVVIAGHVLTALQTIVSRNVDPLETAVVTVGSIQAGTAFNVIPPDATLKGTVRTFSERVRKLVARRFKRLVTDVCKAFGAKAEIDYRFFLPATVNDVEMTDLAWSVAEDVIGKRNVVEAKPSMASEDMSLALQAVPGVFAFVGGNDGTPRTSYPHHHPQFDVNEVCLEVGAAFTERFVRRYLAEYA